MLCAVILRLFERSEKDSIKGEAAKFLRQYPKFCRAAFVAKCKLPNSIFNLNGEFAYADVEN